MFKQKRIPTLLALLILLAGFAAGVFLVEEGGSLFLQASSEITPRQVKITNLTDSGFTLSWITDKQTSGFIVSGEDPSSGQTALDDRDSLSGEQNSFFTHYVTLKNLKKQTKYFYKFSSGGKMFDNNGKPYEITTALLPITPLPPSDVASGVVSNEDGSPAEGAIVYITLPNMTPQSALVRTSGSWLVPLNTAFSSNLNGYASYDKEAQVVEIFVQGISGNTTNVVTTTKNDNPVPEVVLGKSYDFRQAAQNPEENPTPPSTSGATATPSKPPSSKFTFEIIEEPVEEQSKEVKVLNPVEGENITIPNPEFFGTGPAGKVISITVESPSTYSGIVGIDKQGNWRWTPPANLSPGTHTLKISLGKKTILRTFTVVLAAENESPGFTATPSAQTPTPTKKQSPTPTLKVTLTPTPTLKVTSPTPTRMLTVTPTPRISQIPIPTKTPTPTRTPTSTRTPTPTLKAGTLTPTPSGAGLPVPGNSSPTFLIFIAGFVFILGGAFLKFVKF